MAAETRWSPSDLAADMKQPSCALVGVRGIKVREIEVPAAAPRQVDSAVATLAPPATLLQVGEGSLTVGLPVEGSVVAAARTVVQVVAEVVVGHQQALLREARTSRTVGVRCNDAAFSMQCAVTMVQCIIK